MAGTTPVAGVVADGAYVLPAGITRVTGPLADGLRVIVAGKAPVTRPLPNPSERAIFIARVNVVACAVANSSLVVHTGTLPITGSVADWPRVEIAGKVVIAGVVANIPGVESTGVIGLTPNGLTGPRAYRLRPGRSRSPQQAAQPQRCHRLEQSLFPIRFHLSSLLSERLEVKVRVPSPP